MQNRTGQSLEHLYADPEISAQFYLLWQEAGRPPGRFVELWRKAEELAGAARNGGAGKLTGVSPAGMPGESGPNPQ